MDRREPKLVSEIINKEFTGLLKGLERYGKCKNKQGKE